MPLRAGGGGNGGREEEEGQGGGDAGAERDMLGMTQADWQAVVEDLTSVRAWSHRGLRAGLVLLTCLVAWAVPNFELFADLIGSFMMTIVGFVIPPLLFLFTFGRAGKADWYHWVICCTCILVGVVVMITGTINAVRNIVNYYKD